MRRAKFKRSRKTKWLLALLGLSLTPLALALLALGALRIAPLRTYVAERLIGLANANMDEKLRLEGVERLDPWGVRVRHVQLFGEHGHTWVDAHGVSASLSPSSLLHGHVEIGAAQVQSARIALPPSEETPQPPEAQDTQDDTPSGWRVSIARASVGAARLDIPSSLGALSAHARSVAGAFEWRDAYRIVVARAELAADLDGRRVLHARLRSSDWSSRTGGTVQLNGQLVDAALWGRARLSGLDVPTPWPQGQLSCALRRVTPHTLAALKLEPSWLSQPVDLRLTADARGADVRAQAELAFGAARIALGGALERGSLELSVRVPRVRAERISGLLPAGMLAGQLDAHYELAEHGALELRWRDAIVADVQVPQGHLSARHQAQLLLIEQLSLAGYERNLSLHGRVNLARAQGTLGVGLRDFDLSRLKAVRGARPRGVLDGELNVQFEGALWHGSGKLGAQRLQLRGIAAQRAQLAFATRGRGVSPSGQLQLRVDGLAIPRVPLRRLAVDAQLSRHAGSAHIDAQGEQAHAVLQLSGQRNERGYRVRGVGRIEQHGKQLALHGQGSVEGRHVTLALAVTGDHGKLELRARRRPDELQADLQADAMDLAPLLELAGLTQQRATLDGSAHLELPARHGRLYWQRAAYRAQLALKLPIAPLLAAAGPGLSSLSGELDAQLRGAGSVEAPQAEIQADAALQLPERTSRPERISLSASISPQSTRARLTARDLEGTLLRAQTELGGALLPGLRELARGGAPPAFSLSAELAGRRLDLVQGVLAYLAGLYAVNLPVEVGGQLELKTSQDGFEGTGALRVTLFGDALDESCVAGARLQFDVDASLRKGALSLRTKSIGDQGGKLDADLSTRLVAGADGGLQIAPAELHVRAKNVLLPSLPGLCSLHAGRADSVLHARGIGTQKPQAELSLDVEQLFGGDGPALDASFQARFDARRAALSADIRAHKQEAAKIEASLPLRMRGALPGLDFTQPAQARIALHALPVSPFLALGDQIGHPRGSADGELSLSGALRDPQLEGHIELKQVSLSVASIAQPLRDVNARIQVHGHRLELAQLTAHDRDGKLQLSGAAELARDWSGQLSAELETDRFPIRRQGDVVGELTTRTSFRGKIDHALDLTGDVRVHEGRFWVTGDTGADVQPLDRHADIHFVDAKGQAEARKLASVPKRRAPRESLSLAALTLRSDKDFWFMHKSFSVQVGLDLKLLQDREAEKLVGEVRIERGNLELLGKPFDIEKGAVRLTGDYPPDPELELKASFEPPAGQKLFVEVHGRASAPIVGFSGAADTPEEAIAIVSGVGTPPPGAEQRAQSDARAFATNLTAGLLSATARRRLGDWVPLISVQSDVTGTPSQARAGFDAGRLIPPFLRRLARGAYVEGIVGNTHESRSGSVGLGVRLEVALPRDLVTSLGYGPGPTWATDLTWVP